MPETRAEWDTAYINDLPDSAFAVILPGGEKDDSGRTSPRSLRKLPHHNAAGSIDLPHLRNALSREPQSDMTEAQHSRARSHLEGHMESETRSEGLAEEKPPDDADVTTQPSITTEEAEKTDVELSPVGDEKVELDTDATEPAEQDADVEPRSLRPFGPVEVRDISKREVDVRLLPWNYQIETAMGPEEFRRGAFADARAEDVFLYGTEHEIRFGLGQDGTPKPTRVPIGRATQLIDRADGPHATFRLARTAGGDEALGLMADGIVTGVSVEFSEVPGGTTRERRNGRQVRIHQRARLLGATPTHRPAYGEQAAVLAVRSQHEEDAPMGDTAPAPTNGANPEDVALTLRESREATERMMAFIDRQQEEARASFSIPPAQPEKQPIPFGEWGQTVLKLLTGERLPEQQLRALDDVITTDNAGVVPPAYLTELVGVIDTSRPFLSTTRRLPTPDSGTQIIVPVINQRPTTAKQATEKSEVDSTKTLIGTDSFNMVTIAGAGDLSIQLIKRSSPSFLDLWLRLLAEAYAIDAEDLALRALFDATGGVGAGNALNPANLLLGSAFQASFDAIRRPPDTIWLSTEAIAEFIDAKATTTNQPLYPGLNASATAAGGITGTISGLRAVHVPALDAHGAYAIVGPSNGFAWAEDGTYTLQVDVPSKAGRDVGLVGMMWFIPWYPDAFSLYNVAS